MAEAEDCVRLTFLGTGTSHGIPMIGCNCDVCMSDDIHDKRTRPSAVIQTANKTFLIDTTPEIRLQCIANNISKVHAVLYTHAHADHVAGMDDLRRFNWGDPPDYDGPIPVECYANAEAMKSIKRMFGYAFDRDLSYPSDIPYLNANIIDDQPFQVDGVTITPIPLLHGKVPVMGYRVNDVAYCTDCNHIPESSMQLLQNLDVFVLDGLRRKPHPTHFNLEQAVAVAEQIGAKQTFFTHIAHELLHAPTCAELPDSMSLAYDGLVVTSPA